MLYATDRDWWREHNYVQEFPGQRWTQNRANRRHESAAWQEEARREGIRVLETVPGSDAPTGEVFHCGGNSTFVALGFACVAGANRVILLGLDLGISRGLRHFFGDHPGKLNQASPYASFRRSFEKVAPQYEERGVKVYNCSRTTTLEAFERIDLELAIDGTL